MRVKIVYSSRMDHIEILLHAPRGLHPIAGAQSPCKLRANVVKMETSLGPEHGAVHCSMQSKQFWHLKTPPAMATI